MDVKQALFMRRSVRKYTDEPVSDDMIQLLLHAAQSGPSACDRRPWMFCVVTDPALLAQLRGASRFSGITAQLDIVVCGDTKRALPMQLRDYWIQDCGAAVENILLQAVELGLGTVWCGLHPQVRPAKRVRQILSLPESVVPMALIHVGHPAAEAEGRDRFNEDRVRYYR